MGSAAPSSRGSWSYSYSAEETFLVLHNQVLILGHLIRSLNGQNYSLTSRRQQGVGVMTLDKTYD